MADETWPGEESDGEAVREGVRTLLDDVKKGAQQIALERVRRAAADVTPTRTLHVPVKQPDPDQLTLDTITPARQEATLQQRFEQFHAANPQVYAQLVRLARRFKQAGNDRCGMKMLFEVVRYRQGLTTLSADQFKLNNNMTSRYARLIMEQEPDLAGFFETRELHAR